MRGDWGTVVRLCCLLVVVLSAVGSPAIATPGVTDGRSESNDASLGVQSPFGQQATPTSNNSSDVLHEDPDEVGDEDELDRLMSYLSGRMNDRIATSTLELSQGQYDAAKSALGDDYSTSLGKYVDVDGETDEDGAGDQYEAIGETQREYVETVQEFRETRREYRAAKQAGDDARARELARRLTRLANEGETQSDRLVTAFDTVSNRTGSDLSESRTQIEAVQANITEQRDEIVAAEFVGTRLDALSYDRQISFIDPLVVTGTLETVTDTPVETTAATFTIGDQTIRTPVEPDGSFTVTYRPTRLPVDTSAVTLRYRPSNSSVYRETARTLNVSVSQVDATVQVDSLAASTYGYADPLSVQATVVVDGTPVERYPVSASLAGTRLSRGRTDDTGSITLNGAVPAAALPGDGTIRVSPDRTDRAVAFDSVTQAVTIASEQTVLDATAERAEERTVVVEGRLTTADGEAVTDQPVTVRIDDETREMATTGATGSYRATLELPADVSQANASVTVAFDGAGTNLESAATTAAVRRVSGSDSTGDGVAGRFPVSLSDLVVPVLGTGLVGLVALALLRRRRADAETAVGADSGPSDSNDGVEVSDATDTSPVAETVLTSAAELLSAGQPNDAVVVAYTGVRQSVASAADVDDSATHWEFYELCVAAGIADADVLERLTAGYEKAAYSGQSVGDAEAEALVEEAASLVES